MKTSILSFLLIFIGLSTHGERIHYPNNFNMPILIDGTYLKGVKPIFGSIVYMSETEVSNSQYHEFVTWIRKKQPNLLFQIYPDTNVWVKSLENFRTQYFQNIAFKNMPVVGVSQDAAQLYCQWLESKLNDEFKANNKSRIKKVKVRLPSLKEWQLAASAGRNNPNYPWNCEGVRYCGPIKKHTGKFLLNCKMGTISQQNFAPYSDMIATEVYSYWPNDYGLFNMSGNVSEWLEERGLHIGGSWNDAPHNCKINFPPQFAPKGSSSIGFRYLIEIVDVYDEDADKAVSKISKSLSSNGYNYIPKLSAADPLKFMSNEICNSEYQLFLNEQKDSVHKPLENVWTKYFRYTYYNLYQNHSAFSQFPVVGISYESAKAYCAWLTEKYNKIPNREYHQVIFRLPSETEWMHAAQAGSSNCSYGWNGSYTRNSRGCYLANFSPLEDQNFFQDSNYNYSWIKSLNPYSQALDGALIPHYSCSYFPNNYGLFNCSGNVAEMIDTKGVSKGGSWLSNQFEIILISKDKYSEPSAALGFRVLAEVLVR